MKRPLSGLVLIAMFVATNTFASDYSIKVEKLAAQKAMVIHRVVKNEAVSPALKEILPRVYRYVIEHNATPTSAPFARFAKYEVGGEADFEAGIAVNQALEGKDDIYLTELPAGRTATALHIGPYEKIGGAYEALHKWMDENQEKPAGAPWEMYLSDPTTVKPEEIQTKVYYPIK